MTLEEVLYILKNEKFDSLFNKTHFVNKITLIKLKKIFSDYFYIPENEIYNNTPNVRFFIHRLSNKKMLDIESVKRDIYNKIPINELCVKYTEPPEVIEEIKNNLYNDIEILNSKFYNLNDLAEILKIKRTTLEFNPVLKKIKLKHSDRKCLYWKGSDIIKNLDIITRYTLNGIDSNKSLLLLKNVIDKIDSDCTEALNFRIRKGYNVFGVNLSYIHRDRKGTKTLYIKKEDFDKILENKKYYVKVKDLLDSKKLDYINKNHGIINYYNFIYKKSTILTHKYIKKDTYFKLKEIGNLYKNNYNGFIDKLCDFIKTEDADFYNINTIYKLVPYLYKQTKEIRNSILNKYNIKLDNNEISVEDTLFLLNCIKSR